MGVVCRKTPSRMGVASRTCCSIQECCPLMAARNCRISFVLSVFPAPDSPLSQTQHCHNPVCMSGVDEYQVCSWPDDAALVLVVALHVEVAVVGDGEYVWRQLSNLLVGVEADLVSGVNGEQLVGIDRHQDGACVCLWKRHKTFILVSPKDWLGLKVIRC